LRSKSESVPPFRVSSSSQKNRAVIDRLQLPLECLPNSKREASSVFSSSRPEVQSKIHAKQDEGCFEAKTEAWGIALSKDIGCTDAFIDVSDVEEPDYPKSPEQRVTQFLVHDKHRVAGLQDRLVVDEGAKRRWASRGELVTGDKVAPPETSS